MHAMNLQVTFIELFSFQYNYMIIDFDNTKIHLTDQNRK